MARSATGTTDEDYTLLAQTLDTIHDMAAEKDLIAVYHPHLTTICETAEQIDTLLERSKIAFCPTRATLRRQDPTLQPS